MHFKDGWNFFYFYGCWSIAFNWFLLHVSVFLLLFHATCTIQTFERMRSLGICQSRANYLKTMDAIGKNSFVTVFLVIKIYVLLLFSFLIINTFSFFLRRWWPFTKGSWHNEGKQFYGIKSYIWQIWFQNFNFKILANVILKNHRNSDFHWITH